MVKIGPVELGEFPLLLAPMEDVSDPPFRKLCKAQGADMVYTEFISADGLVHEAKKTFQKLEIFDYERPIGIQYFGGQLENMIGAAGIIEAKHPDVIDINFGCPVAKVACRMAGAGLLKDVPHMVKLTEAVVKSTNRPVTVKTRLGWDESSINILEVAERLQDVGIQALSIHARTRAQMYKGEANWAWIAKVKENPRMHIPIFGNGDVDSPQKALDYRNRFGPDGIMIGRASIGYPWIFREIKHYFATGELLAPPTVQERVQAARQHLLDSLAWKGPKLGVLEMRRHYAPYFKGLPDIKPYRARLVTEMEPATLLAILEEIEMVYGNMDLTIQSEQLDLNLTEVCDG
ncbi:MAG TPA: tRNA dihydrouridine synthase DusB [Saprospiraceae bacterium]|nr:tRNA dihydrouridine synthase DusB [Saprospiraceae bacterium]